MAVGKNIRRLRESRHMTQRELGQIAGVSDKAVSTWENESKEPRIETVRKIAAFFGVSVDEILKEESASAYYADLERMSSAYGLTPEQAARRLHLPKERFYELRDGGIEPTLRERFELDTFFGRQTAPQTGKNDANVLPYQPIGKTRRIPVLGRVPAGVPIEAITDVIDQIDLSGKEFDNGYTYFALLVTGDSMFPEYRDGDVVIIRAQSTAETGDDVVAYVGRDDATLKRITVSDEGVLLRPLNPAYPVRRFSPDEVRTMPVTVAGIVVEQRRFRRHI